MARRRSLLTFAPLVLVVSAAAAAAHGCTIMNGLTLPEPDGSTGVPDADVDADTCNHAYPPADPPALVDDGTIEIVVAVRTVDLGLSDVPPDLDDAGTTDADADAAAPPGAVDADSDARTSEFAGFDLDRTCTCPGPPSCVAAKGVACDDPRGRDNGVGVLVRAVLAKGFDIQRRANENTTSGASGTLFRIEGYNGKPDDPSVYVTMLGSPGLRDVFPDGGASTKRRPTFTAADKWTLDPSQVAVVAGVVQSLAKQPGFVRDHQVTVRVGNVRVPLIRDGLTMELNDAVFVARIVPDGAGGFTIRDAEVAGRWVVRAALRSLRDMTLFESTPALCEVPALYESIKAEMCNAVDIAANSQDDGRGLPCDAISASLRFVAGPASLGTPWDEPAPPGCPDAAVEDDCPR